MEILDVSEFLAGTSKITMRASDEAFVPFAVYCILSFRASRISEQKYQGKI